MQFLPIKKMWVGCGGNPAAREGEGLRSPCKVIRPYGGEKKWKLKGLKVFLAEQAWGRVQTPVPLKQKIMRNLGKGQVTFEIYRKVKDNIEFPLPHSFPHY
jgi:hypothetical protein